MAKNSERLPGLDGLRGALALMVAYNHAYGHFIGWGEPRWFVLNAAFAVDVFFAMSGVVLYVAYRDSFSSSNIWGFFAKRFFRLYPLYLLSLVFLGSVFLVRTGIPYPPWLGGQSIADYLGNFFLCKYVGPLGDGLWNDPAWSIAVELWVGTFVAFLSFGMSGRLCVIAGAVTYFVICALGIPLNASTQPLVVGFINPAMLRCVGAMFLGVGLWRIFSESKYMVGAPMREFIVSIGFLCMAFSIFLPTLGVSPFVSVPMLFASILGLVFLPSSSSPISSALNCPFMVGLGDLSFSVYLLHSPVVFLLLPLKGDSRVAQESLPFLALTFTLLLAIPASHFEKFGISVGKKLLTLKKT